MIYSIFKKIRGKFMPPCQKCKWFKRIPAIILVGQPGGWYCTKPEITDKYSMKDYHNYDMIKCKLCRGEFHCRFEKKEEE